MASRPVSNSLLEDHQRRLNGLERANREKMRTVSIPTYDLTKLPDDLGDGTVFHSTADTLCVMSGGVAVCTPSSVPAGPITAVPTIYQHLPLYNEGHDPGLLTAAWNPDSACFKAGFNSYSSTSNDVLGWDVELSRTGGSDIFTHHNLIIIANHGPAISDLTIDLFQYGGVGGWITCPDVPTFVMNNVSYSRNEKHEYLIYVDGAAGDNFANWTGSGGVGHIDGGPGRYRLRISKATVSASYFELQSVILASET